MSEIWKDIRNHEGRYQVSNYGRVRSLSRMVNNLERCTNSENQIHAYKNGLNNVTGRAGRKKRSVLQIDVNTDEVIAEYESINEAGRSLGMKSSSNIGMCCRNEYGRNTAYGYKWKYKEVM